MSSSSSARRWRRRRRRRCQETFARRDAGRESARRCVAIEWELCSRARERNRGSDSLRAPQRESRSYEQSHQQQPPRRAVNSRGQFYDLHSTPSRRRERRRSRKRAGSNFVDVKSARRTRGGSDSALRARARVQWRWIASSPQVDTIVMGFLSGTGGEGEGGGGGGTISSRSVCRSASIESSLSGFIVAAALANPRSARKYLSFSLSLSLYRRVGSCRRKFEILARPRECSSEHSPDRRIAREWKKCLLPVAKRILLLYYVPTIPCKTMRVHVHVDEG